MFYTRMILLFIALIVGLIAIGIRAEGAQQPPNSILIVGAPSSRWEYRVCFTNGCIGDLLNSLPSARSAEAKLATYEHTTYVWFRK